MFTFTQIAIITIWTFLFNIERQTLNISFYGRVTMLGMVTGLIMGDIKTGLLIGGTMELMGLGVNPLGGAPIPNYEVGCIVGTAFACTMGQGLEIGLATGVPAAALGMQLNIVARTANSFFLHKTQNCFSEFKFKAGYVWTVLSMFTVPLLQAVLPVFLILVFGSAFVEGIINNLPVWILEGFSTAGNILPALGFAILLKSLPIKGKMPYLILGYLTVAYLGMPVIAVAILGLIIAMLNYTNGSNHMVTEKDVEGEYEYE